MPRKLIEEQRLLIVSGFIFAILFIVFVVFAAVDQTQILGINRWIKPMKFASSIAIFLTTLAVYLYYLEGRELAKRIITVGVVITMFGEILLIGVQAARGVGSHFNISTPLDGLVFSTMGAMIGINTILVAGLLILYLTTNVRATPVVLLGMRLGIVMMLAASVEGGYMSAHLSHAVGVADGGPGLPLLNWSTTGGDLRVAHFVGLHGLQAIPLFAVVAERCAAAHAGRLTVAFGVAYFVLFTTVFVQSFLGRPLF